jgi:hypothetical protein
VLRKKARRKGFNGSIQAVAGKGVGEKRLEGPGEGGTRAGGSRILV